jgi:phosphoribosyl 1,2-cyclic phosphodiesterase
VRILVLGSGSSGNAAIVEADGVRLLIDAGMGPRKMTERMRALGVDLFPRGVDGIVVTHHHSDHAGHLEPLARACRAPVFLHRGIDAPRVRARYNVIPYDTRAPFTVERARQAGSDDPGGTLAVEALPVPHDAPQVALRVSSRTHAFGIATDLGRVPRDLPSFLGSCDAVLVEANHCPELLRWGPYPPRLRARVAGGLGHLANEETAELAWALAGTRVKRLYLGHISRANNTPERALDVVKRRAGKLDVRVVLHGVPQVLAVPSGGAPAPMQLGLPF